jgi:hypothetical protein
MSVIFSKADTGVTTWRTVDHWADMDEAWLNLSLPEVDTRVMGIAITPFSEPGDCIIKHFTAVINSMA